jgi:6-pyruvoyl-tetrahydropterin synthase
MENDTRTLEVERSTSTAHRLTHYDGACGNIHGHNMTWEVEVTVDVDGMAPENMPVDLKEVSDAIDRVDHAAVLGSKDELVERLDHSFDSVSGKETAREFVEQTFGDVIWLSAGDPTCEVLADWMARRIYNIDESVTNVRLSVAETDKYSISTGYSQYDEMMEKAQNDD